MILIDRLLNRTPKVEFISSSPLALECYPIIKAKSLRPAWYSQEVREYASRRDAVSESNDTDVVTSVARCPGITKLLNEGWIVTTHQDIYLEIDKDMFGWATPIDDKENKDHNFVSWHNASTFKNNPNLAKKIPILKILTPWFIKIPKGFNLFQLPVPYSEETRFYSASGIFERAFGYCEVNIQLFWQAGSGKFLIPAGTPLAQLILIKENKVDAINRLATKEDLDALKLQQRIKMCTYKKKYLDIKNKLSNLL
jgi:hypothetical protein